MYGISPTWWQICWSVTEYFSFRQVGIVRMALRVVSRRRKHSRFNRDVLSHNSEWKMLYYFESMCMVLAYFSGMSYRPVDCGRTGWRDPGDKLSMEKLMVVFFPRELLVAVIVAQDRLIYSRGSALRVIPALRRCHSMYRPS